MIRYVVVCLGADGKESDRTDPVEMEQAQKLRAEYEGEETETGCSGHRIVEVNV